MKLKLTADQMEVVKGMALFAEASANQIYHIMENHGLDKVIGCRLAITVIPENTFTMRNIVLGSPDSEFGYIDLARGKADEKYAPIGKNSAEYELLFADEAIRSRMEKILHREKPLPPDGLWVSSDRNSDPVDGWEWDINDSLS
jgi:hypothetical protein